VDERESRVMDKSRRRTVFVLYVILFLLSITTVSAIQISQNRFSDYTLNIEYERHSMTATSYSFDHSYSTIRVDIPIMIDDYESTLNGFQIGPFPLCVDISDWTEGGNVRISGLTYLLSVENRLWKAHRDIGDQRSESLYYHKELGIFIKSDTDQLTMETTGFSGYTIDIEIQQSNIDGFVARLSGSNVVGNIVLLSSIFTEILIVQWLYSRRQKSKTIKSSK
jgi:hypothetical protein